jgi:hypothetical protein
VKNLEKTDCPRDPSCPVRETFFPHFFSARFSRRRLLLSPKDNSDCRRIKENEDWSVHWTVHESENLSCDLWYCVVLVSLAMSCVVSFIVLLYLCSHDSTVSVNREGRERIDRTRRRTEQILVLLPLSAASSFPVFLLKSSTEQEWQWKHPQILLWDQENAILLLQTRQVTLMSVMQMQYNGDDVTLLWLLLLSRFDFCSACLFADNQGSLRQLNCLQGYGVRGQGIWKGEKDCMRQTHSKLTHTIDSHLVFPLSQNPGSHQRFSFASFDTQSVH